MAYALEIWYSESSMEDEDFLLWDTVPEAELGDYYESIYSPVAPGQVVYFKARRQHLDEEGAPDGPFSAWSNIVSVTAPTPEEGFLIMRDPAMGLDSVVAFGLQPTAISTVVQAPDRAVQGTNVLEYTRGRVRSELAKFRSRSLGIGTSRSAKSAAGRAAFPGGFDVELTPVIVAKLLTLMFGPPTTTVIAATTGPTVAEHYRHVWKNNKNHMRGTFLQLIGDEWNVTPGVTLGGFDFGVDKEGDDFITAALALQALNSVQYASTASAALGITTADLDPDEAFTPLDGVCILNNADSTECHDVTASINRNPRSKNVLDRLRGVQRHYPGIADITMSARFYFSNRDLKDLYYGQVVGHTLPHGITKVLKDIDVILALMTEPNSDGYSFEFGIHMPKASLDVSDEPIEGSDEIMQEVTFSPDHDLGTLSDCEFYVVNGMTNAEVIAVGSAIATYPANKVTSYSAA